MNFQQAQAMGKSKLQAADIADAATDAWLLLSFTCGIDRNYYYLHMAQELTEEEQEAYGELLLKRAAHIPLQHLTGTQEFMGLVFHVNENVLVPRMETELLVEEALHVLRGGMRILDVCTGSGCIVISLMKLIAGLEGSACDVSVQALAVARENAASHGVAVDFFKSDMFSSVTGKFDMVISNPPYIPSGELESLMPEVRDFEPQLALDGGTDGYDFYHKLAEGSPAHLNDGGYLYMEIGHNQGTDVAKIVERAGFTHVEVKKDLQGLERLVTAKWQEDRNV